ncbi:MAG: MATE family efflux transporter [Betaproteobacteria bacterium]
MTLTERDQLLVTSNLRRSVLRLIWPAATENLLQLLVGFVNLGMVGRLGAEALGAVSLANRLTQIVWALFLAFGTGAVIRVAQASGGRDERAARHVAEQTLVGAAAFVSLLAVALIARADGFLAAFRPEPAVVAAGTPYLRLLALGMPFFSFMLAAGSALRGAGDTWTPMLVAALVNAVNVVGNYVLIFGRLGFPALGLQGSAIATATAQLVGAAVAFFYLRSPRSRVRITLAGLTRLDWATIRDTFLLGLPNALETLAWQVAAVIMTGIVITHGTAALAGYQVGLTVEGLSYMPAAAFAIAATASVGQALGGRDLELARRSIREVTWLSMAATLVMALALFFFPRALAGLLTPDPSVIAVAALYLRFMAVAQLPQNLVGTLNGALRGAGRTREPLIAVAVGLWGIRLPLALHFTGSLHWGLDGIWWAIEADFLVRLVVATYFYRRGMRAEGVLLGPAREVVTP